MRLHLASALLLAPLVSGCDLWKETLLPGTTSLLTNLPVVENSPKSPCWQQRQIAQQRSYIESITTKKERAFAAPCDVDPKPKPVASPEAKTS